MVNGSFCATCVKSRPAALTPAPCTTRRVLSNQYLLENMPVRDIIRNVEYLHCPIYCVYCSLFFLKTVRSFYWYWYFTKSLCN